MARESTVFAEVGLADNLLPDRNAPLVNPLFPFLTPALFRMLHDAAQSGQWLRLVQPSRFHPVGSFVATQGRQDFSLTLDGPRWKELETLHVGSIMPLTPGGNSADSMVLVEADEQTCLWVRDEASFALATRLAENNAYDNFIEQQRLTSKLRWVRRRSP